MDADLEKLRDGNFCLLKTLDLLKTTVKTAVKTLAFVWSNFLQLMRINEIRVLQSKGTINIQVLNIRASFLPVVISFTELYHRVPAIIFKKKKVYYCSILSSRPISRVLKCLDKKLNNNRKKKKTYAELIILFTWCKKRTMRSNYCSRVIKAQFLLLSSIYVDT